MRKAVENKTAMPIYVAGMMIPPGETRLIEDDMLPPEHRTEEPTKEPEAPKDPLVELAEGNVKSVLAAIGELSDEDLARLQVIEFEGKARKGVLEGIAEEGLKRAQKVEDAKKAEDVNKMTPPDGSTVIPPEGEKTPPDGGQQKNPEGDQE